MKGLCGRCYRVQLRQEQPDTDKNPQRIDRTAYLEEFAARNRAWYEQHYAEKLARERRTSAAETGRRFRYGGKSRPACVWTMSDRLSQSTNE